MECGGGEGGQEGGIYAYLWLDSHSYCCTAETNTIEESNYIPIEKYLKIKKGKKEGRKERRRKERKALTIYYCRGGMVQ